MNAKRWFAWVCLALMLVAEFFLFRANHERDAALADMRDAQQKLHDAQTELDALKTSSAGLQPGEATGLRRQNEVLTAKVKDLQSQVDRVKAERDKLQSESQQTSQRLNTARTALQLQQEHLQQLQVQQQAATAAANASTCIGNLRAIENAKARWALEKEKGATDVPTSQDLLPYLKDGVFPVCPDGGSYSINSMSEMPACTISGHVLTQ